MSASGETSVVMEAITHGACDYLIKPLRMEVLRNIWQHVVRRRASGRSHGARRALIDDEANGKSDDGKNVDSPESRSKKSKQVATDISCHHNNDLEVIDDISGLKRFRVHWTVQLHEIFVRAVNQLGIDKAMPKRILDIMKVQGLTRENVASHLQKYRLYLKRLRGSIPEPHPIASFQAAEDGKSAGTMQICSFRRPKNVPSSSSCLKGPSPCLEFGSTDIDAATVKSVEQYGTYRQNLVAHRSARRLGAGAAIIPSNVNVPKSTATLYRMSWLNLDPSRNAERGTGDDQDTLSTSPLDDLADQNFKDVVNILDLEADPFGVADDYEEDDRNRVKGISWIGKKHEEDFSDNFVEEFGVSNAQVYFMATPPVVHSLEHDPVVHSSEHGHVFDDFLPPQAKPR